MAVEPLYNASKDALLNRARIKTADDTQTLAMIDQAISEVRMGFFRSITSTRALAIAAYSLVDNPSSDEEILKATAANTEANWVVWLLAQRLPYLFMDNRSSVGDAFNEEQLTRDSAALKQFLDGLKTEIDKGLGDMAVPVSTDTGSSKAASITNTGDAFKPFDSFRGLYPYGTNLGISGTY